MTAAARMLIVEDEPALIRGLTDMFRARGFEVSSARDGASGLDAALSDPPDVILLDIMLPKMNGYEICRAIRDRAIDVPHPDAHGEGTGGGHHPRPEPRCR